MSRLRESFRIGDLDVAAISDGAPERALGGFFHGVEPAEWTRALGITNADQPMPFNFGAFLVRSGGTVVLIDSGLGEAGASMGVPGGGELPQRLAELGVMPADVNVVVHTHLHGDHCGWDAIGDTAAFPNAKVYVSATEVAHWNAPAQADNQMALAARRVTSALRAAGTLETFDGEKAVLPWLTMIPTPGHTPGHCSVMLTSGGEHLLVLGDAAHHPVHLEHHTWLPAVDIDPAQSTQSRGKVAALAADNGATVTGGHFPILTLGKVRRVEGGYRWEGLA